MGGRSVPPCGRPATLWSTPTEAAAGAVELTVRARDVETGEPHACRTTGDLDRGARTPHRPRTPLQHSMAAGSSSLLPGMIAPDGGGSRRRRSSGPLDDHRVWVPVSHRLG